MKYLFKEIEFGFLKYDFDIFLCFDIIKSIKVNISFLRIVVIFMVLCVK